MPWLSTWSAPESTIAPTSTGTPTASTADSMPRLSPASRNGSDAVEFSGQSTKSGCGSRPASMSAPRSIVACTWFWVTWRGSSRMSSPSPGTLPCTTATVRWSVKSGVHGTSAGSVASASAPSGGGRGRDHAAAGRDRAPARPASCRPGPAGSRPRQAHVGQGLRPGGVGGGVGQPAPRHPAQRPAGAHLLDRHPRGRHPDRPGGQPVQDRHDRPEQPEEQRLDARHEDPRVVPHHAHPEHQRVAEGDAEDESGQPGATGGQPHGGEHEERHRDRHDVRRTDGLEGQHQREAADQREGEAAEHAITVPSQEKLQRDGRDPGPSVRGVDDRLPTPPRCLGNEGPSRIRPRGADRPPRTMSGRWWRPIPRHSHSDVGPPATICTGGRRYLEPLVGRFVNRLLTCTDAQNRRSARGLAGRAGFTPISPAPACRARDTPGRPDEVWT